jgi:hypothetical protein
MDPAVGLAAGWAVEFVWSGVARAFTRLSNTT